MKAVVYTNYGPPEVLQVKDVPKPIPKNDELLVRVHAATMNRTDCANISAKPFIMRFALGLFKPAKQIPGTEFSGVVEATGAEISKFKVGDKVFGFDDGVIGSLAEYLVISEENAVSHMPEGISFEQAAASSEGAHYAYNIYNKVDFKPGDKVMVNGASGGIGSASVQLLHYFQADITAVCDTKNIELIKSLGARKVIDYTKEDFTKDSETYDYVFDTVGKSTFGKCTGILAPGGTYISSELGPWIQNVSYSLLTLIFGSIPFTKGRKVKFPYPPDKPRTLRLVKKLTEEGYYKPVIDRRYPLEKTAEAYDYVRKGLKTGNVVITIDQSIPQA